ncbi:MarR family transcriptional regulator [Mycolicibacterium diernhoferi]|uniref:MarR family transcriptional regulator n=1 Tax=Mycolicibacterium diernhoferi TaxID=1801 RepID=A0A2A7NRH7_9MYCO|nr:MarR family transcriptional regulator [Mycolicibacterium diernhoferi]QYL22055.1 MarR family transcriptional regulator [Mycolicibacterium diernhoferi]
MRAAPRSASPPRSRRSPAPARAAAGAAQAAPATCSQTSGFNLADARWVLFGPVADDGDPRLASDLSLAVVRLARQLRFRRPDSPVSLTQLSALATVAKEGPMTPGALAARERVRPPSMTRVIASLVDVGFIDRTAHPDDGRQVLITVSASGTELIEAERRASREWLAQRLAELTADERATLLAAADLMLAIVDEGA